MRRLSLLLTLLLSLTTVAVPSSPPARAQDGDVVAAFEGVDLGDIRNLDAAITDIDDLEGGETVDSEELTEYAEQIFVGSVWTLLEDGDFTFEFGSDYDLEDFSLDEEQAVLTGTWEEKRNGEYGIEIEFSSEETDFSRLVTIFLNCDITTEDEPVATVEYAQTVVLVDDTTGRVATYTYTLDVELQELESGGDTREEENSGGDDEVEIYTNERHGFQLEFDPETWVILPEMPDIDPEDRVSLTNGPSRVIIIGDSSAEADALDDCVDEAAEDLQDEWHINSSAERDGADAAGTEDERAWKTLEYQEYENAKDESDEVFITDMVAYVECLVLSDDTVVVIWHIVEAENYDDDAEARDELLEGLSAGDGDGDDSGESRDSTEITLPEDPDTVVISVSVNTGSLPPEFQAGYDVEITADGQAEGEIFPEGSLADEPTAELEEIDAELGEEGLIELLTEMDELGFFDLPPHDDADIPDGGSVHYVTVELADDTWVVSMYSLKTPEQQETFEEILVLIEETLDIERPAM